MVETRIGRIKPLRVKINRPFYFAIANKQNPNENDFQYQNQNENHSENQIPQRTYFCGRCIFT